MPFSLRLDRDTEDKIRRLGATLGRSKSAVIRDAVAKYAAVHDVPSDQCAFDRLKPFIGIVSTGGANLSKRTHEAYRAILKQKHRARRAD